MPGFSTLARKGQSFGSQPAFVRAWLLPTWLLLGLARLLILAVSFKRLATHLGEPAAAASLPLLAPEQQRRARLISRTVQIAARHTPWTSNCFPQAVVARWLLGWHGIPFTLCFGLQRDADRPTLRAHAWVASDRIQVTGGEGFGHYAVVGIFISPPGPRAP